MATLTPYRYPGAKNRVLKDLVPYIIKEIKDTNQVSFCDAFVGGGSVLLEIAILFPKILLFANDKDQWIASFWKIVVDPDSKKLNEVLKMMESVPTLDLFNTLRNQTTSDEILMAYKAIFFNRTAFSGILSSGPIGGKEQKSQYTIDCRYNFLKLKNKILRCHQLLAGRTQIDNKDFSDYPILKDNNCPIYLDPPYFKAGKSLYPEYMVTKEHNNLSLILSQRKHWILSYDKCDEIMELYKDQQIIDLSARYCINGKKNNWIHKNELIILSK